MYPSPEPPLILIVEDNEPMRLVLQDMLQPEGYRILEAADGMSALLLAEEQLPSLVLLDLGLPSLSGLELAQRFQGWMPFLVLTIDREDKSVQTCLELGALGYILKPPEPQAFLLQVRAALVRGKELCQLRQAIREARQVAKATVTLMMYFHLPEDVAHGALVERASTERRRVVDMANEVFAAGECIARFRWNQGQGLALTPETVAALDYLNRFTFAR